MKTLVILAVCGAFPLGCMKSSDHAASTKIEKTSPNESSLSLHTNRVGKRPATVTPPIPDLGLSDVATAYPEKSTVLAILDQAREMRQLWQFDSALALVSQALAIDPASPMAQSMEREIAEILQRLQTPARPAANKHAAIRRLNVGHPARISCESRSATSLAASAWTVRFFSRATSVSNPSSRHGSMLDVTCDPRQTQVWKSFFIFRDDSCKSRTIDIRPTKSSYRLS